MKKKKIVSGEKKLQDYTTRELAFMAGRCFGKRSTYYMNEIISRILTEKKEVDDD
jgi:hypothetical protein